MIPHLLFPDADSDWRWALSAAEQREMDRTNRRYHGEFATSARTPPWNADALVADLELEILFEAMAARVPIVAARVGGVPNVVGPAEAILVPPGDPTELASAIHAVRADPLAARARAQAAHDRLAREFRVEPWLARYEQLYHEIRS